ncbi:barstar family protein [Acuticoccus kandeliae]|uniref:barstar family protein n=1 Tax=Acuticoccus kandeliae TaxID=2073160 RepID=UPI000D3E4FE0|nr:barstar family protein [Acuticoccus kandeliae]
MDELKRVYPARFVFPPGEDGRNVQRLQDVIHGLGYTPFLIDGKGARSWKDLVERLKEDAGFPGYMWQSIDSVEDCFEDFGWVSGDGAVLIFTSSHLLLRRGLGDLGLLFDVVDKAAAYWAKADVLEPEIHDRPFTLKAYFDGATDQRFFGLEKSRLFGDFPLKKPRRVVRRKRPDFG